MNELLQITKESLKEIYHDAEKRYPFECCGFLFGSSEGKTIEEVMPIPNVSRENLKRRFQIDPMDYLKAENWAEKENKVLLGIYHSHPDHPAIPSEHDRKYALPHFSYWITSVEDGVSMQSKSWVLDPDRNFKEEYIRII